MTGAAGSSRRFMTALRLGVAALVVMLVALTGGRAAQAHNLPYALADIRIGAAGEVQVALRVHLTPMILGAPQGAPDEAAVARVMALSDAEIAARSAVIEQQLLALLTLRADGRVLDNLTVRFPTPAEVRTEALTPPDSPQPSAPIAVAVRMPTGAKAVDIALPPSLGPAVVSVRYADGQTVTLPLTDGRQSPAFRLAGPNTVLDQADAVLRFVVLGFGHILPGGLDHILFVVALVMGAPRFWPLVKLATSFTVAHSITLSLAALGLVSVPGAIVEPAIALSIAVAALLSLRATETVGWGRLALVFGFGLLHGLGFAGVLQETGLPRGAEIAALAAFNIGIELAQLAVIALVLVALRLATRLTRDPNLIARPITIGVALIGVFWTVQRIVLEFAPSSFAVAGGLS